MRTQLIAALLVMAALAGLIAIVAFPGAPDSAEPARFTVTASAVSQNLPSAASGTTNNCGGEDTGDWTAPENAFQDDNTLTTTTLASSVSRPCSKWTGFSFGLPSDAAISKVEAVVEYRNQGTGNAFLTFGPRTLNGPTNCGTQTLSGSVSALTVFTLNFTGCKSWSAADFNSDAIQLDVAASGNQARLFEMDYISYRVTYTSEAAPGEEPTQEPEQPGIIQLPAAGEASMLVVVAFLAAAVLGAMAVLLTRGSSRAFGAILLAVGVLGLLYVYGYL